MYILYTATSYTDEYQWTSCHTFKSSIHLELIFVYSVRSGSNLIGFHVAIQFPAPFVEDTLLSLVCTQLKISSLFMHGFISGLSLLFHWSTLLFMQVHWCLYCFDYCIFVMLFEIRKYDAYSFDLSQNWLGYS